MKTINLIKSDLITTVNDEKYEWLNHYVWYPFRMGNMTYAYTGCQHDNTRWSMHEMLLPNIPLGYERDHIDRNGLNNLLENLRIVTHAQNNQNKPKQSNNKSGYKGVSWNANARKWIVQINVNKQHHYLGLFDSREEAAWVYNEAAKRLHGEFAVLNTIV